MKVCSNPNTLATHCWKTMSLDSLGSCGGTSSTDCGLFCASSNIQCAKVSLKIISGVAGVAAMIAGGLKSTVKEGEKGAKEAEQILKDKPVSFWTSLLESGKSIYNTRSVKTVKTLISDLSKLMDFVDSIDFECMRRIFKKKNFNFFLSDINLF